jgi:hypothetical protein
MSINYNNVAELLELIYKFVYKPDNGMLENYVYKRLEPSNITMSELVKSNDFEYQYILNTGSPDELPLEILDSIIDNSNNKKVIIKKYLQKKPILMIIQKNENNLVGTTSIIDIYYEFFMNQIISEFIIHDKIPFYLINICNFNIGYNNLITISDYRDLVIKEYKLLDPSDSSVNFCISLYEHYHQYISLKELLKTNLTDTDIANILFQVLFSYAYLNFKLGNFRHNTFTVDSFLVAKLETEQSFDLMLGDLKFNLPNTKYVCKLFNFRNSVFDKYTNIYKCIIDNPSYDIYTFYKSLYDYTKKINTNFEKIKIIISNFIPTTILDENLLPENNFINKYPQSIVPSQILTKNNFFSSFINMNIKNNFKQLESDKKLIGGVIQSLTENSDINIEMLKKHTNMNENGKIKKKSKTLKKSSKTHKSKKNSKNKSKKNSKTHKSSKKTHKVKMSRETMNVDNVNTVDADKKKDVDTENENKKVRDEIQTEVYEEVDNIDEITPDQENQNDDLLTDGDDDRQKVPTDDTEKGKSKSSKSLKSLKSSKSSKSLKKSSKKNSKKSSKKSSKKNSKNNSKSAGRLRKEILNLENEIKYREEKLKLKHGKSNENNSSTISFNFSDSSSVKQTPPNNNLPMMQQQMQQMQQMQQTQQQTPQVQNNPNIMLPSADLPMAHRQRTGTNNDMNALLQQLNEDQLIPVLPEMQQMFDMNQLEMQQHQAYQRGQVPIDNYGGQPQIMDQSIVNMARNGKLPIPLLNGLQMSPGMGMGMGMGGQMGQMGPMGPMGQMSQMSQMSQMGLPMADNVYESGLRETTQSNLNEKNSNDQPVVNDKLVGGNKNYFLKKKH